MAWAPEPADGIQFVDPDTLLRWEAGFMGVFYNVYVGTDANEIATTVTGGLMTLEPVFDPTLEPGTTYYWRADLFDGTRFHTGDVWSFTTVSEIPMEDPGLLGWWTLDEGVGKNAVDWSGHGRHAALGDPAPDWAFGVFGGALEFSGDGDQAVQADGTFLNGLDALTIAAWVKSDLTHTDKGFIILEDPHGADDRDMRYDAEGGTGGGVNVMKMGVTVATDTGDTIIQLESSDNSQTTEWQHVAMVWSSGEALQLYINGNLDAPTANAEPATGTLTGNQTVIIGRGGKDEGGSWDGLVDDVRIYDRALTQEDIMGLVRGDPLLASAPHPGNGATADPAGVAMLRWTAGDGAAQHDVYLGTDRAAVSEADASDTSGIYRGRQSVASYTPALEWGRQYFWRVDEVQADGTVTKGLIWSFVLNDFLTVDDFEGYANAVGARVFEVWIDGVGFTLPEPGDPGNGTGATGGHDIWTAGSPHFEQTIMETGNVHGGGQAMPLYYDNTVMPYRSEAQRTWTPPQDWTVNGVEALTLYIAGAPDNAPDQLYVLVEDSAGRVGAAPHPDPTAATVAQWTQWPIPLSVFSDAGVNLAAVKKMTIGVGDRTGSTPGGTGMILLDDIRVVRP
jgi:hypothetical protein